MSGAIKLGIIGLGNCASSLVQGIMYFKNTPNPNLTGVMNYNLGSYRPQDINIVAAFDIDVRKVGKDVSEAIFAKPNCTKRFFEGVMQPTGTLVSQGLIIDSIAPHMEKISEDQRFIPVKTPGPTKEDIVKILKDTGTEVLINYLPVGSQKNTEFYAECALSAGVAMINCIPVFIASNEGWAKRFKEMNVPIIGDDIKSQLGATILHRAIATLFKQRGIKLLRTYQLNVGGNTDFLNMLDQERLKSKKISKTESVQAMLPQRLESNDIHIGPSDYVPWLHDNKVAFIRMEAEHFGGVPMNVEIRLSVEDSPNSAGVAIDMIRCARLALDRGTGGVLYEPSAFFCKHPAQQYEDSVGYQLLKDFIKGT